MPARARRLLQPPARTSSCSCRRRSKRFESTMQELVAQLSLRLLTPAYVSAAGLDRYITDFSGAWDGQNSFELHLFVACHLFQFPRMVSLRQKVLHSSDRRTSM